MFWNRKEKNSVLAGKLDALLNRTERISEKSDIHELREAVAGLSEMVRAGFADSEQERKQISKVVQKHDMEIEDLLDAWENRSEREKELESQLRAAEERNRKQLELISAVLEQYSGLKRVLTRDSAWAGQLEAVEKQLEAPLARCGLSVFGKPGELADTERMQVLKIEAAGSPEEDYTVAEVYVPGLSCGEQILRRAEVSVYRYSDHSNK